MTDVTEQTFRTFLQWAHAQLYSSGFEEPIPDQSILGSSTTEESETAANDQNEYSDDEEEDASDHGSDHDSDHSSSQSPSRRSSNASRPSSYHACGGCHSSQTSVSSARLSRALINEDVYHPPRIYFPASCESLVEMREKYELRKKNYDMAHVFVVLIESCSIDGMAMAI